MLKNNPSNWINYLR